MIKPRGNKYTRWSRKGKCPGCGVVHGSNHSPGCKYREGLIAAAQANLYGIPIFTDDRILDHQAICVGEKEFGDVPYTLTYPIMIIDLNTNTTYGHRDITIKEIRVSKAGKPKFLELLANHGVVEQLQSMREEA